jgi:hypothetical protein
MGIDPVGVDENNVHSHNRYAYGNNNPYKYVDPTGNIAETALDVVSLGLSIAQYKQDPSLLNGIGLAYDVIGTAVPILPAGFGIIRSAGKAGVEAAVAAKNVENVPAYARNKYKALDSKTRQDVLSKDSVCVYCEVKPSTTVDHVRSQKQDWIEGGFKESRDVRSDRINNPKNLRGACNSCNPSKGSKELGRDWTPPKDR